jgi:hypothetical protein
MHGFGGLLERTLDGRFIGIDPLAVLTRDIATLYFDAQHSKARYQDHHVKFAFNL